MPRQGWPDWDIYVQRGCRCEYCGFDGTTWPSWNQLVIDHIIPKSQGGKDSPINKAVACSFCNHRKGWYDPRDGQIILEPTDEDSRDDLIARARTYMRETDKWSLRSAFTDMMVEIDTASRRIASGFSKPSPAHRPAIVADTDCRD